MSNNDIIEICISTNFMYMSHIVTDNGDEYGYNDKLRISKHRISYKKTTYGEKTLTVSWDYKDLSNEYHESFDRLCTHIMYIEKCTTDITDSGVFNIEIIYTDKTKKVIEYTGSFHHNNLDFIAYLIRNLIPNGQPYSPILYPSSLEDLHEEELSELIVELTMNENKYSINSDESYGLLFHRIFNLVDRDYDYPLNFEKIEKSKKEIKDFSFDEVKTMITYIKQREKFSPGSMPISIEDSSLLKLLKRLSELYYLCDLNLEDKKQHLDFNLMYDIGMKYANNKEYDKAIRYLSPVALNGDDAAQNNLGAIYSRLEEYAEAIKWYRLANTSLAKENILRLYNNHTVEYTVDEYLELCQSLIDEDNQLGYLYLSYIYQNDFKGVEDHNKAFGVLLEGLALCEINDRLRFEIAYLLECGLGCEENNVASHKYYKSILDTNNVVAKYNYALQCKQGRGCEQDIDEAIKYFTMAAEAGYQDAIDELEKIYSDDSFRNDNLTNCYKNNSNIKKDI